MTSLLRLTHFISQSASFTPFNTPVLAILYFALLTVRPKKEKAISKTKIYIFFCFCEVLSSSIKRDFLY